MADAIESLRHVPVEEPDLSMDEGAPQGRHMPTGSHACGEPYVLDKEDNPYCPIHGEIRHLQR